jgi:hypothetical protein
MARYGFDIDGTVNIAEVAHLARTLMKTGHKVYFITANPASRKTVKAKLHNLNLEGYKKLLQVDGKTDDKIGQQKGHLCDKYRIAVFFDNNPTVLKGITKVSAVARLMVMDTGAVAELEKDLNKQPPKKRDGCPCFGEVRSDLFVPVRCFHCRDFLETPFDKIAHREKHHPA